MQRQRSVPGRLPFPRQHLLPVAHDPEQARRQRLHRRQERVPYLRPHYQRPRDAREPRAGDGHPRYHRLYEGVVQPLRSQRRVHVNVERIVEFGELGLLQRPHDDDAPAQLSVPIAPRPVSGHQNEDVALSERLFLLEGLLQRFEHQRVTFVLHQPPCDSYHQLRAARHADLGLEFFSRFRIGREDALVDAVDDDVDALLRNHVDPLEDVPDVVAGGHVVGIAGEELDFLDHLGEPLCHDRAPPLVAAPEQVLNHVGVDGLVGDAVPGRGEVAEATGAAVEDADALRVDHFEWPPGGVVDVELLPRQGLVEEAGRGGVGGVEDQGGGGGGVSQGGVGSGGEDVHLVAAAREGEVEREGVALEAAGAVALRPALDEEGDLEEPRRGAGGVRKLVEGRGKGEDVQGPIMLSGGGGIDVAGSRGGARPEDEEGGRNGDGEEEETELAESDGVAATVRSLHHGFQFPNRRKEQRRRRKSMRSS